VRVVYENDDVRVGTVDACDVTVIKPPGTASVILATATEAFLSSDDVTVVSSMLAKVVVSTTSPPSTAVVIPSNVDGSVSSKDVVNRCEGLSVDWSACAGVTLLIVDGLNRSVEGDCVVVDTICWSSVVNEATSSSVVVIISGTTVVALTAVESRCFVVVTLLLLWLLPDSRIIVTAPRDVVMSREMMTSLAAVLSNVVFVASRSPLTTALLHNRQSENLGQKLPNVISPNLGLHGNRPLTSYA